MTIMALRFSLALCGLLAPAAVAQQPLWMKQCGQANLAPYRIIGGWEVTPHKYPWMVFLEELAEHGVLVCGGSLITDRHVLTAAHCVGRLPRTKAYLGMHRVTDMHLNSTVDRRVIHAHLNNFDSKQLYNDIAILTLDRAVAFSRVVRPICLPTLPAPDLVGRTVIVAGWGRISVNTSNFSNKLKAAKVTVRPLDECKRVRLNVTQNQLCLGSPTAKSGACNGDSGGPAMDIDANGQHTVIGLVSYARSNRCALDPPEVFTKVSSYLSFIRKAISDVYLTAM